MWADNNRCDDQTSATVSTQTPKGPGIRPGIRALTLEASVFLFFFPRPVQPNLWFVTPSSFYFLPCRVVLSEYHAPPHAVRLNLSKETHSCSRWSGAFTFNMNHFCVKLEHFFNFSGTFFGHDWHASSFIYLWNFFYQTSGWPELFRLRHVVRYTAQNLWSRGAFVYVPAHTYDTAVVGFEWLHNQIQFPYWPHARMLVPVQSYRRHVDSVTRWHWLHRAKYRPKSWWYGL